MAFNSDTEKELLEQFCRCKSHEYKNPNNPSSHGSHSANEPTRFMQISVYVGHRSVLPHSHLFSGLAGGSHWRDIDVPNTWNNWAYDPFFAMMNVASLLMKLIGKGNTDEKKVLSLTAGTEEKEKEERLTN